MFAIHICGGVLCCSSIFSVQASMRPSVIKNCLQALLCLEAKHGTPCLASCSENMSCKTKAFAHHLYNALQIMDSVPAQTNLCKHCISIPF